jgi:phosphoglycerate dehydrogenase-like enzyme
VARQHLARSDVDTDALTAALTQRRIASAWLEVTEPEPHPLFSLETVAFAVC